MSELKLPKPVCPKSGTRQPSNLYTEVQLNQYGADFHGGSFDIESVGNKWTIVVTKEKTK
jgi:hypothetical protein